MATGLTRTLTSSAILSAIGLFTVTTAVIKTTSLFGTYIRPSKLKKYAHPSKKGEAPWALVTGASDGIGRAYARELAANGFNVVLHGRNEKKLRKVKSELRAAFPKRSFTILVADATTVACANCFTDGEVDGDALDFSAMKEELDDLNLTVLVNNVGGNPTRPAFIPLKDREEIHITENISLNALFPVHLTRALLPNLIQNSPSLLVNVSTVVEQGLPLNTTYTASKQFLSTLTHALRMEMALEGIADKVEILGIKTGRVTGVANYKEPPSFFAPDANTFARSSLGLAGHGSRVVIGYWTHAIQYLLGTLMPSWLEDRVLIRIMRSNRDWEIRKLKQT
ncbi:NAD(P)-binding protein [Hypoxylon trugodes]|uniref:NAD(P)-binding protein n=1 Tax=Hypoxylon trugodes TaxID=326681 RepID=UPI0021984BA6|nr:NAD(P)-binding protein [Hypoxylon trugodes]KAI1385872.1 NAD(P)-binding protein [Hypoxylon trugodes]